MIVVHHLNNSRSQRVLWLLEELAGAEFTAADIQMSFPLEASAARGGLDSSRPRLMAWLERIHARPAYRRALESGGRYDILR